MLLAQGRLEEGRQLLDPLLPRLRSLVSGTRLLLPSGLLCAARLALAQHRFAEAVELANESLAENKRRARDPARSADVGEALLVLASAYGGRGDVRAARDAAGRAATSLTAGLGADNALTQEAAAIAKDGLSAEAR